MSNVRHVVENLSAYLDDELSAAERARVEAHLRTCAQCQRELESLRYTMRMVRELPARRAPRSFTLADEQAAPAHAAGWFVFALRAMTALSALLLIVVVSADLFLTNFVSADRQPAQAPSAAMAAPTQARAAEAANQDTVLSKAAPTNAPAAPGAFGAPSTPTALPPTAPVAPATPTTSPTRAPFPAGASTAQILAATATPSPTATATNTTSPTAAVTVSPTATRTLTPTTAPAPAPPPPPDRTLPLRLIEFGLFGLFAVGISALIVLRATSRS